MDSRKLAIPIYLNTRIVFDLLAIVEGGFSQLQSIRTSEASSEGSRSEVAAQVGASNVFAFLGIGMRGAKASDNTAQNQREVSEDRVFTPASLFSRLRDVLDEGGLLRAINDGSQFDCVQPETFVEFSANLRKNPLIDALEGFVRLGELTILFQGSGSKDNSSQKKRQSQRGSSSQKSELEAIVGQVKTLLQNINHSNTIDLMATLGDGKIRAVVPVELEYFSDKSPAAIIDGRFVVLGKVVQVVGEGEGESIDLLRSTSLSYFHDEIIDKVANRLDAAAEHGLRMPKVVTNVEGPAFQVIPIAIFA